MKGCKWDDCTGAHAAKGYCSKHYQRYRRLNDCGVGNCTNKVRHPEFFGACDRCYRAMKAVDMDVENMMEVGVEW